jgi:excisionase family DNA binding protein
VSALLSTVTQLYMRVNQRGGCGCSLPARNIPPWHPREVTAPASRTWLTVPELVDLLGVPVGRVRRLIDEHSLPGTRVDGVLKVPADFIRDGEPLHEVRGTVIVLHDAGYTDDEALNWMLAENEVLGGVAPIDALRAGRKAEVRRVAQALGF